MGLAAAWAAFLGSVSLMKYVLELKLMILAHCEILLLYYGLQNNTNDEPAVNKHQCFRGHTGILVNHWSWDVAVRICNVEAPARDHVATKDGDALSSFLNNEQEPLRVAFPATVHAKRDITYGHADIAKQTNGQRPAK